MARPRNFDEAAVVALAGHAFARLGFNATSIEDLLEATGLQRGSLYKAFGSKRNLFENVLMRALVPGWRERRECLDLFIIALMELAAVDQSIARICQAALTQSGADTAEILGQRLLEHLDRRN